MVDVKNSGEVEGKNVITSYRAYKRRWAVLLTVFSLNLTNQGLFVNLVAVAYKAADYYEVTLQQINFFSQGVLLVPIPLNFASTYIFDKFDMKVGIHIGAALNCLGAVMRAVGTSGLISDISAQFIIGFVGQIIAATSQLFILFIITKVAQNWFPEGERIGALTLMAFVPPVGTCLAQVMAPLIVTDKEQIPTLNYVYGGLAIFSELVTIICVTRARPPTPPSRSVEQCAATKAPYLQQLKDIFTCLPYLGLLIATGIYSAWFVTLLTMSQQMLCSMGYSDLFSGVVVSAFNLTGFLGSILVAVVAKRTHALTPINKLVNGIGVSCAILMMVIYLVPDQHALVLLISILYGLSACGAFPLSLELSVETSYPVDETISTAAIYVLAQILGVLMTYTMTSLSRDLPPQLQHVEVCTKGITSDLQARDYSGVMTGNMVVMGLTGMLFTIFFHTPYKRMEAEKTTDTNDVYSINSASYNVSCRDYTTRL